MSSQKIDRVLEELQSIKTRQAVTNEQLKQINANLDRGESRFKDIDESLEAMDKRIDFHDKVVGAIVIAVGIFGTMVKFKII